MGEEEHGAGGPGAAVRAFVQEISHRVCDATAAVDADPDASAVVRAVVAELARKSNKAMTGIVGASESAQHDFVVELEQAADSAKAAAEADPGLGEKARAAVLDAHLSACTTKFRLSTTAAGT